MWIALVSLALAGPEPWPVQPTLTLPGVDLRAAAPVDVDARRVAVAAEAQAVDARLAEPAIVTAGADAYFGAAVLEVKVNLALQERLRDRLHALGPEAAGDRSSIDALGAALARVDDELARCRRACQGLRQASEALHADLATAEALVLARVRAAAEEQALVLRQLAWLERARLLELSRIRRDRDTESRRTRRVAPELELPAWLVAQRLEMEAARLREAERARQRQSRLDTLAVACKALIAEREHASTFAERAEKARAVAEQTERDRLAARESEKVRRAELSEVVSAARADEGAAGPLDAVHAGLLRELDHAFEELPGAQAAVDAAQEAIRAGEADVRAAVGALAEERARTGVIGSPEACVPGTADRPGALDEARLAVMDARAGVERRRLDLLREEARAAGAKADNVRETLRSTRHLLREVLPWLSEDYRDRVYAFDTDYFRRMGRNLATLGSEVRDFAALRWTMLRQLPERLWSWSSLAKIALWLTIALFMLAVLRFAIRTADALILAAWHATQAARRLRDALPIVLGVLKLLSMAARPLVFLAAVWLATAELDAGAPEAIAIRFLATWTTVAVLARSVLRALLVECRWNARRTELFRPSLGPEPIAAFSTSVSSLLYRTSLLIGMFALAVTAFKDAVELLLGQDYLYHLVSTAGAGVQWVVAALALVFWRGHVAEAWSRWGPARAKDTILSAIRAVWGAALVPLVVAALFAIRVGPWLKSVYERADGFHVLRLLASRRRLRQLARERKNAPTAEPPPDYAAAFAPGPAHGQPWFLGRPGVVGRVLAAVQATFDDETSPIPAIVGAPGAGKTTTLHLVSAMIGERHGLPIHVGRPDRKLVSAPEVVSYLARLTGLVGDRIDESGLIAALNSGQRRVIAIDDAHHVFLRATGAGGGLTALIRVLRATSRQVVWLLTLDDAVWYFMTRMWPEAEAHLHAVRLDPWTEQDLEGLIVARNAAIGWGATFDEDVLDPSDAAPGLAVGHGARGYFRLLADLADDTPDLALRLWLASAHEYKVESSALCVGLRIDSVGEVLSDAPATSILTLMSIVGHGALSRHDLARCLEKTEDELAPAVGWCERHKLVESVDGLLRLSPLRRVAVVRHLRMGSFIYHT